jgi:hypothetical protein
MPARKYEDLTRKELIATCKRFAKVIAAAVSIRRFFKGEMYSLSGKEDSLTFFDREVKQLFGWEIVQRKSPERKQHKEQL